MPDPGLVVRPATPADAGLVAALGARTFRDTYARSPGDADVEDYVAAHFAIPLMADQLRDPRSSLSLAFFREAPAGYVQVREGSPPACVQDRGAVELRRLYVDRPWFGRGLGSVLLQLALDEAERRGAGTLWLGVWEGNTRARAFYRARGFREVGFHDFPFGGRIHQDPVLERPVRLAAPVPLHRREGS